MIGQLIATHAAPIAALVGAVCWIAAGWNLYYSRPMASIALSVAAGILWGLLL